MPGEVVSLGGGALSDFHPGLGSGWSWNIEGQDPAVAVRGPAIVRFSLRCAGSVWGPSPTRVDGSGVSPQCSHLLVYAGRGPHHGAEHAGRPWPRSPYWPRVGSNFRRRADTPARRSAARRGRRRTGYLQGTYTRRGRTRDGSFLGQMTEGSRARS
ncbi:hypothetical protein NDU88_006651 [Pleurodeles waltl]|uniref:Uncharacterized protein n=1 Tax=Pleurodeles waltl TaxID=8319 RepID=A0AAV7TXF2_PLEWA|nr:hypothetical protein NDU88_006651 [Pleurodeles waltl]